jgi:hypothetical protein
VWLPPQAHQSASVTRTQVPAQTVTTFPRQPDPSEARRAGPAAAYIPPVGCAAMHVEVPGRQYHVATPDSEVRVTGATDGLGRALGRGLGVGAAVGRGEALGLA